MENGTPKNIDQAIYIALSTAPTGKDAQAIVNHFKVIIKDYLSQRFTVAQLNVKTQEAEKALAELWIRINY